MTFFRHAVACACLFAVGSVHALSLNDFGKVVEGTGAAIDLNDANVVLIQEDSTGFVLFNLASGTRQTVPIDAGLQAQGFTSITVRDLNNRGQVSGLVNGTASSGFVWSPSTGFVLCPSGYCSDAINDDGLATSVLGFWTPQTGAIDIQVPGYLSRFNNLAQRSYIRPPAAQPEAGVSGAAVVGVLSREGVELWSDRFSVAASSTGDPIYAQQVPDTVILNDQGLAAVGFDGVKSYSSSSRLYVHGVFQSTINGAVLGMNNRGQMVTAENLNNVTGMGPAYATTSEFINLKSLVGILPLGRINDSGVILQQRGSTFAVYQGPNLSGRPSLPIVPAGPTVPVGTGKGLQGDYFNVGLFGNKLVTTRIENPDFDWGTGRPAPGVNANAFVVRWSGFIEAEEAGDYQLQTQSDEGVRVTLDGQVVINNWRAHRLAIDTSSIISMKSGQRLPIVIDYYDILGNATMRLNWRKPGASAATTVPTVRLYQP